MNNPLNKRGGMAKAGPRSAKATTGGRRSSDMRSALIAAAVSALREVGFGGASAREIARRAGCNQSLVFYHFGSVTDLLLAALDDTSARRMAAYRGVLDHRGTLADFVDSARSIFVEDLDSGHVTVLIEMITGAQSSPGLGEQVMARLAPWREFAETAIRHAVASSPVAALLPAKEAAHGVVAGYLGLELLAHLDGDRSAALALFDRARALAGLLDMAGAAHLAGAVEPPGDGG